MKVRIESVVLYLTVFLGFTTRLFSQDIENSDSQDVPPRKSKFNTGFYVGSYFANKYSASAYNGYGFDIEGKQNTFLNSFMYQKIKNEFGGGYGQYDQVAEALGVDRGQWEFTESDMAVNMRYTPAIMLGFNFKIPVDKKSSIIFNVNGTNLSVEGNFTMSTLRPPTSTNPANNTNLKTFPIKGREQRMQFQLAFQHVFGAEDKINLFGELGFVGTLAKFDKNWIYINTLQIDLTYYVNQTINPAPGPTRVPVGFGLGAFAGVGFNIAINPKFSLQLLYTLSHEKVNIGVSPALKLQNSVGFRVYYNI